MPEWYTWLVAGLIGAAIGSFLNVCIHRLPEGESVISPRSRCPQCSTPIPWSDNLPLVSWALLRGRCRTCATPISVLYPVIELVTGVVWVAAVVRFDLSWEALGFAVFFTLLLGIAVTDARTYLIPHEFSRGGLAVGLLLATTPVGSRSLRPAQGGIGFLPALAGAALGFGVLWLTAVLGEWWLRKPAMGGGDIWMMGMVGAFLGPAGAVLTIFMGALVGILVWLPISLKTKKLVPFGVFLAVGAAVTHVWGPVIVDWYRGDVLGL